jgi:hypothetical protein
LNEAYALLKKNLDGWMAGPQGTAQESPADGEPGFETIASNGDNAIRDAIIMGWLKRVPRDARAVNKRSAIESSFTSLSAMPPFEPRIREYEFFLDLFGSFLKATEYAEPKPFSVIRNSTMFFHYLSAANSHLDDGIRNFYRFIESNNMAYLFNIPASFLEDALRLYGNLHAQIEDPVIRSIIECRRNLAGLYKKRIKDPELSVTWQYIY